LNYVSYWASSYMFNILIYCLTMGISIMFMVLFGRLEEGFILLCLLFGIAVVPFLFVMSFLFKSEQSAQRLLQILSLIVGNVGGFALFFLSDSKLLIPKIIYYSFSFVPFFSFQNGFVTFINKDFLKYQKDNNVFSINHVGWSYICLACQTVLYLLILYLIEKYNTMIFIKKKKKNLVHDEDQEMSYDRKKKSIEVEGLVKHYNSCCKNTVKAVNNISFNLNYGDCFALLGVNGAGKTTTFKCLTFEIKPSQGDIAIDSLTLSDNFNKIRSSVGYCPQFDAFFEYLTVKENLEIFANIRGIHKDKVQGIVNSMMEELKLAQFKDKVAVKLRYHIYFILVVVIKESYQLLLHY
jgi:ATP-binding cassette subfamily A (ABC1) protein 3